jgi:hypothetical protein
LGVVTLGVFGLGVAVQAGTPTPASPTAAKGKQALVAGNGVPEGVKLPVFPPVRVDLRKSADVQVFEYEDGVVAIGGSAWEPFEANSRAATPCVITEQCAICDKCIDYSCEDGKCTYTPQTGSSIPYCDDEQYCNGAEECDNGTCVAGTPPCGADSCDEESDTCYPFCAEFGANGCDDGDACTRDVCDAQGDCDHIDVCTPGRCCTPDKVCQALNLDDCDGIGGTFLATDDPCDVVEPSGHINGCPKYGSGVAPEGETLVEVGPISNLACDDYFSMGDDYCTQNWETDDYMAVHFLRFAGGVLPIASARWSIGFHDSTGLLVVNVFWPDGINDSQGLGIKTVDFDPPLIVPTCGYISFRVQGNFGLDGRVTLASTTAPADKGENDPTEMWVDDQVVADFLGQCAGGDRGGLMCDRRNGNTDCTGGGTCEDVPDVLIFEIVGEKVSAPLAACCAADTAACTQELPWECLDNGGTPQDPGTLCGICDDGLTPCSEDQDCIDAGAPTPCNLIPVCATGACCDPATGGCTELADDALCADPLEWQGFGTDCDPNCCELPSSLYTGEDNSSQPPPAAHIINVPDVGDPPITVTITGDNTPATYDDYPDFCDAGIFNEAGGTKDPGWWEIFTIDDCAEIRIDLCCTNIAGDVLRPAWGNLVMDAGDGDPSCDNWFGSNGVDPPVGIGRDTSGFARGGPFCGEDNLWSTYGPMRAGKYMYPIYSAPGGTAASPPGVQYQMHVTVGACPNAACCVQDQCSIINELECADLDGYWHLGTVDCGDLCETGSCCTGPGECIDELPGGEPMTLADCTGIGDYVGGAVCTSDPPPCPVCDIEGASNCQLPDLTADDLVMMSDLSMPPGGVVVADDFIPAAAQPLSTVCVWGAYLDPVEIREQGGQNDGDDCNDDVTDNFRITVYPDDNGKPDDKNPVDPDEARVVNIIAKGPVDSGWVDQLYGEAQMYAYQLQIVPPIEDLQQGVKYWLEVANDTEEDADDGACMWHWTQTSAETNDFHYIGTDYVEKNPAYIHGGGRGGDAGDMAWCVNMAVTAPDPVEGTCCDCDAGTCTSTTVADCTSGLWDQTGTCPTCSNIVPGDVCAVNPIVTSDPNFQWTFDNTCADTDGSEDETSELGIIGVGADLWVHYIAPCDGKLHVSMCGTGNADNSFDSALAVYQNTLDATDCACPGDDGFTRIGLAQDESCNGIADGGAGYQRPAPIAAAGNCYTVRVGGFDADGGTGTIKIGCEEAACTPTPAPENDPKFVDIGFGRRTRYVSFSTSSTINQAMRVTFVSLPPPFDGYNGDQWWVGTPYLVTESSGSDGPAPAPTMWAANLTCAGPVYLDWSQYGVVDILDAGIVPEGVYAIQAVADDCNTGDEDSYSVATPITNSAFCDVTGAICAAEPCSPPQGVIDFTDIGAVVEKFKNTPGALQKSRADVINSNATLAPPDKKIDFVDISGCVESFRGSPPPLPGPQTHCP